MDKRNGTLYGHMTDEDLKLLENNPEEFWRGVREIGAGAFDDCTNLKKLTIPKEVEYIDGLAFIDCVNLESIDVDKDNLNYRSEGNCLLSKDGKEYILGGKDSAIPDGVESIGSVKYVGSKNLRIPASLTEDFYFLDVFDFLETIDVDKDNPKYKSEGNCLLSKDGKTLIAGSKNSVIPNGVESIDYLGVGPTDLWIPASVKDIPSKVLSSCVNIETIKVDKNNPYFKSEGNCLLSKDGKTLIAGCKNSIIPEGVEQISQYAFRGQDITHLRIPASVKYIGFHKELGVAYGGLTKDCIQLDSIEVDKNNPYFKSVGNCLLSKDGKMLIAGCKNSIIPEGVEIIANDAFSGCKGLKRSVIPISVICVKEDAYKNCSADCEILIECEKNKFAKYGSSIFRNGYYNYLGQGEGYLKTLRREGLMRESGLIVEYENLESANLIREENHRDAHMARQSIADAAKFMDVVEQKNQAILKKIVQNNLTENKVWMFVTLFSREQGKFLVLFLCHTLCSLVNGRKAETF